MVEAAGDSSQRDGNLNLPPRPAEKKFLHSDRKDAFGGSGGGGGGGAKTDVSVANDAVRVKRDEINAKTAGGVQNDASVVTSVTRVAGVAGVPISNNRNAHNTHNTHNCTDNATNTADCNEQQPVTLPSIPQPPPQLPRRPATRRSVQTLTFHPRQDDIYTALKPSTRVILSLPADFIVKGAAAGGLLGLQGGRVFLILLEPESKKKTAGLHCVEIKGAGNRNVSGVAVLADDSVLVQHASGQLFSLDQRTLSLTPLFKACNGNLIVRPPLQPSATALDKPIGQALLVGAQETFVIEAGCLKQRIPSHFSAFHFVSADEIAVPRGPSRVDLYSLSGGALQPASLGYLDLAAAELGQLLRCVKVGDVYACVHAEGKLVLWRLEHASANANANASEGRNEQQTQTPTQTQTKKILVPVTLSKFCSVHVEAKSNRLWLGCQNGHLLVVEILPAGEAEAVKIVAELKGHEAAITKIFAQKEVILTIDTGGLVLFWDRWLSKYEANRILWQRQAECCTFKAMTVRICSWNVAAQPPTAETNDAVWKRWLGTDEYTQAHAQPDLLIVGLQEIVDLAFMSGPGSQSTQSAIDHWSRELKRRLGSQYRLIHTAGMVGLGLLVFVRGVETREAISEPGEAAVKTGLGGMHGNKGALVWRAFLHDTPIAVVVAHLAAGQKSVHERNNDATAVLKSALLPEVAAKPFAFPTGNSGSRIFDHSVVLLFGDLNYRIEAERDACEAQVRSKKLAELLRRDQLQRQLSRPELLLSAFEEAALVFAPTYKYDRGTLATFDSSEKRRVPAWCDRILMHAKGGCEGHAIEYDSVPEATASDHKPIFGTFELSCRIVDPQRMGRLLNNSECECENVL